MGKGALDPASDHCSRSPAPPLFRRCARLPEAASRSTSSSHPILPSSLARPSSSFLGVLPYACRFALEARGGVRRAAVLVQPRVEHPDRVPHPRRGMRVARRPLAHGADRPVLLVAHAGLGREPEGAARDGRVFVAQAVDA